MSFNTIEELRKSRGNFDTLLNQVEKMSTTTTESNDDGKEWKPTVDQAGNGYAVIRFLPPAKGEDQYWARLWTHGFQGPTGKWYIENSLTTLGKQDPVSELNSELWNSGVESNKDIARKQKRRQSFYSNILVVKDPSNPDNEGNVFLYRYGKKIFDKIQDLLKPEFEDETPVNPFDFWEGRNFKLKIRQVEGFRNYDKSEFESAPSPVAADDEIEAIWAKQHSLAEIVDPSNFKSYEDLKSKLDMVLQGASKVPNASTVAAQTGDIEDDLFVNKNAETKVVSNGSDSDDDAMSYFAKLADDS
mgnify:FL=1|tara:strand:+ start:352 stop:1257 length:906 start_codon:yes stop_codon:yes gene_type:complete